MGFLDKLFGKKPAPAPAPREHALYPLLFGDAPWDAWPADQSATGAPWDSFRAARAAAAAGDHAQAIRLLTAIGVDPDAESRARLQAWHFLRQLGQQPPVEMGRALLGVVVEVSLPGGLDVVAAYADGSARYLNHAGRAIVWEAADNDGPVGAAVEGLLAVGREVVPRIGLWEEARLPAPTGADVRLSFLTPDGLLFGQGPMNVLSQDAMGGPVVGAALRLMQALMAQAR